MSAHIERTVAPKNADPERTHLNREMIEFPDGVTNRTEAIQHRLDSAGLQRKIGKNQVRAVRILLTGSPDDMKRIEQDGNLDKWCSDNLDWLRKTYGADNIVSAVLHLDETTPHIHATMIPIVTGERRKAKAEQASGEKKKKYRKKSTDSARLCADDVMSRVRLKEYQNTYAEQMAKYGLKRGIEGSEAKHVATSQYYRDLLNQTESVQENIATLLEMQEIVKENIYELESKRIDVRRSLDILQAEEVKFAESVQTVRSEHREAQSELSKVKADISKERLKNTAADVGATVLDGVGSLFGSKTKQQQQKIEALEVQNRTLADNIKSLNTRIKTQQTEHTTATEALKHSATEQNLRLHDDYARQINSLEQRHKVREQELIAESNSLRQTISKLMGWLPLVGELLRMEKICTAVGFTAEQISQLAKGVAVRFSGSLYSEEHKRRFETQNSTAKVVQESQTQKLNLIIDGIPIVKWFTEKYTQYKEQQKTTPPPPKRGIRM